MRVRACMLCDPWHVEQWITARDYKEMVAYIQRLSTRGAPMIGVAASLALAQEAARPGVSEAHLREAGAALRASRPTAVNLMHCMDRLLPESQALDPSKIIQGAYDILDAEVAMNDAMAAHGAALVQPGENILTHCNTGSLATPGVGTALGVIRAAHRKGLGIHVYVDETRPLLQGGRLTAYELKREGYARRWRCQGLAN